MSDLISRQAAIDICRAPHMRNADCSDFEMAIRNLPPAQPDVPDINVGDMISRQAAIDMITNHWSDFSNKKNYKVALACVDAVPPALPEPMKIDLSRYSKEDWERIKKEWANTPITAITAEPERINGHWIDAVIPNDNGGLPVQVCDQCNTFFPLAYTGGGHSFCPHCGADMREVTE